MKANTHNYELKESGTTFRFSESEFEKQKNWIEVAISNSRILVDEISMINGLTKDSEFDLSNIYATFYWLPMRRNSNCPRISVSGGVDREFYSYIIAKPKTKKKKEIIGQMNIFELAEGGENEDG